MLNRSGDETPESGGPLQAVGFLLASLFKTSKQCIVGQGTCFRGVLTRPHRPAEAVPGFVCGPKVFQHCNLQKEPVLNFVTMMKTHHHPHPPTSSFPSKDKSRVGSECVIQESMMRIKSSTLRPRAKHQSADQNLTARPRVKEWPFFGACARGLQGTLYLGESQHCIRFNTRFLPIHLIRYIELNGNVACVLAWYASKW